MNDLPDDLLLYIFKSFHPIKQNNLRLVCKLWSNLIKPKDLKYRLKTKTERLKIGVDKLSINNIIDYVVVDEFLYIISGKTLTKINILTGDKQIKEIFGVMTIFNCNNDKILLITNEQLILFVDKKTLETNDIKKIKNNDISRRKIIFDGSFLYTTSIKEHGYIVVLNIYGKTFKKIKICDNFIAMLLFGYNNNLYIIQQDALMIWNKKTESIITKQKMNNPYDIAVNKKNYNYIVVAKEYIFLYNKENILIKTIAYTPHIKTFAICGFFVFKKWLNHLDTDIYDENLEKSDILKINPPFFSSTENFLFEVINMNSCAPSILIY